MTNDERGSALVEALPAFTLLFVFCVGFLLASYILFARAWIQYQSEQALYCLAQNHIGCHRQLDLQLHQFLPKGKVITQLYGAEHEWHVEVEWHWRRLKIGVHKTLTPKLMLRTKALHW